MGRGKGKKPRLSSLFPLPGIPRALPFFPSPQAYGQETFVVKAARKRPLRRREFGAEANISTWTEVRHVIATKVQPR